MMALSLREQDRSHFFTGCFINWHDEYRVGQVASREEVRLKSKQQLSQVLKGKSYSEIMAMAINLLNDARFMAMVELETLEAGIEFQHDADIERPKHLEYLAEIEEHQQKTGRHPLADGMDVQNYVFIASPSQQRYTSISPPCHCGAGDKLY